MPPKSYYKTPLQLGKYYHIFNRSVADEKIFSTEYSCNKFLQGLKAHLSPFCNILAWCLIPNHFHLFIHIKGDESNNQAPEQINVAFNTFFKEFALKYNRTNSRSGPVLASPFKRVEVDSIDFFTQIIYYIHHNPSHHGVQNDFWNYRWSSYQAFTTRKKTSVDRETVLGWFGGLEAFAAYHEERHDFEKALWMMDVNSNDHK